MEIRCAVLALCLMGCGGSGLAGVSEVPSTGDAGIAATVETDDAAPAASEDAIAQPVVVVDAGPPGAADAGDAGDASDASDAADEAEVAPAAPPSDPPDAGRAPDAGGTVDAASVVEAAVDAGPDGSSGGAACRTSFVNEFHIGGYGVGSPTTCPGSGNTSNVDLCAAATTAYVAMCAGVPDDAGTTTDALACAAACNGGTYRKYTEAVACFFDCWLGPVCGLAHSPLCRSDPTLYGNVSSDGLGCLEATCFVQFDPSAF